MLTIATVNVNGIRAAVKQRSEDNLGFLDWLSNTSSDVVLLQEVRATEKDTLKALAPALDQGWHFAGAEAAAKGRAGVGILSRTPLLDVSVGIAGFEDAGRYLEATTQDVRVASLYLPSGEAGTDKQDEKFRFLDVFEQVLGSKAAEYEHMVIGGDWNICHRQQDLKNWKNNQKRAGFLPDERAFMDAVFGTFPDESSQIPEFGDYFGAVDYVGARRREANTQPVWFDAARRLQPDDAPYSWWSYRGKAFDTDAGWRIDYQAVTRAMLERAHRSWVEKADRYDLRWSDHAPVIVEYR